MFYTTETLNEDILLQIKGSEVSGRVWCVAVLKKDRTHRIRKYDGFYKTTELKLLH